MKTTDFAHSYLRFRVDSLVNPPVTVTHVAPTTLNNVRINLECTCELTDRISGESKTYYLGASCKTERVGSDRDLWLAPNADFSLAAAEDEFLIIKQWARRGWGGDKHPNALALPQERQLGRCREVFVDLRLDVRRSPGRLLSTLGDIIAATQSYMPLVSRTEYEDGDYRVVIEHPVKTMNYTDREQVYQTDTGPILLPDLSAERLQKVESLIECFDLAYSAFNSAGWAEFIVNVPTSVAPEVEVDHYSRPRRIEPVRNQIIAVLDESQKFAAESVGEQEGVGATEPSFSS